MRDYFRITSESITKAFLFDVLAYTGLEGTNFLSDYQRVCNIFAGATFGYALRDIVRPFGTGPALLGGVLAGAIKYSAKGNNALFGAYNNCLYEVSNLPAFKAVLGEDYPVILIESTEGLLQGVYKEYQAGENFKKILSTACNESLMGGFISFAIIGIASTCYSPLLKKISMLPGESLMDIATISTFYTMTNLSSFKGQDDMLLTISLMTVLSTTFIYLKDYTYSKAESIIQWCRDFAPSYIEGERNNMQSSSHTRAKIS